MYRKLEPKLLALVREGYTAKQFQGDLLGGLTVGIVALPLAIALAIASGVKPEQGLYTAIFAGFVIAVLGGTRAADQRANGCVHRDRLRHRSAVWLRWLGDRYVNCRCTARFDGIDADGRVSEVRSLSGCRRLHRRASL